LSVDVFYVRLRHFFASGEPWASIMLDNINNAIDFLVLDNLFIVLLVVLALLVILLMIGLAVASIKERKQNGKEVSLEEKYKFLTIAITYPVCFAYFHLLSDKISETYLLIGLFVIVLPFYLIGKYGPNIHRNIKARIQQSSRHKSS